ncbi:MAG: metallophosphoesterase family protein [Spirulina sp. SIO3F2]|nr:metallophosphoesterase family protein [Spirulina sp. SIO3F2]
MAVLLKLAAWVIVERSSQPMTFPAATHTELLLTDPFLQLPTPTTVNVVWFTEFEGRNHRVNYGDRLERSVKARSQPLTRLREDSKSHIPEPPAQPTMRTVWRHEAIVTGLTPGENLPYQIQSQQADDTEIRSAVYRLAPQPVPATPLKILLTSDHQLMPRTAANLEKVAQTVDRIDGIFLAGDLVNIPDRASEWFDDQRGNSFFACLQGRASYELVGNGGQKTTYKGAPLLQNAPLFTAIGNHEMMGRFAMDRGLNEQFNDPIPQAVAAQRYDYKAKTVNPSGDPEIKAAWIKSQSFNSDTYEQLLTLPQSKSGGSKYYATTFGDVRLVVLDVTNIWRSFTLDPEQTSRYREPDWALDDPEKWGYGQHIFEPITPGSDQYAWLEQELFSDAFQQARYKVVMFHHPPHTLGDNIVPAYTNPRGITTLDENGKAIGVRYEYPLEDDYIHRYLEPLFNKAGVNLVYYGHSHLWNRFQNEQGVNFLESSNVGNTYGAYWKDRVRPVPVGYSETYRATGDPNGLEPIMPTIARQLDQHNAPLPYLASNEITAFSILDTETGLVSSYWFDTREPDSEVVLFDQFAIAPTGE